MKSYKDYYNSLIIESSNFIIIKYNSSKINYEYKPFSHKVGIGQLGALANLLIDNMVFYTFDEEEILQCNEEIGILEDLRIAAKYAYLERLPKRIKSKNDGTPGELLLDLLIQIYEPDITKLLARAKYSQMGDANEIKGYDALYFTKNNDEISLWLGQVKTGSESYCKTSIICDLNEKYVLNYFSKSICYIADKTRDNSPLLDLVKKINKIKFECIRNNDSDQIKGKKIASFLKSNNVSIKIPCLLVYSKNVYSDEKLLNDYINSIIKQFQNTFDNIKFNITIDLDYELMFYIFPVEDIDILRTIITDFKVNE